MDQFICLKTTVRRETRAASFLSERGVKTYAPQTVSLVRMSPRKVYERLTPLFPAYFFAEADSFYDTRARLGGFYYPFRLKSEVVGTLDGSVIDEIRDREQGGIVCLPKEQRPSEMPFERGDEVIVNSSSIVGVQAIFEAYIPEKHRVLILMKILGREQVVPFDIQDVSITKLAFA